MAYRTEPQSTGGGLDPFRIGGLLCLLPILGPPLLMGVVRLLVWALLRRRWDLGKRWVALALLLSLIPGWVSHQTRPGGPLADYLATHNALGVASIRLAMRVDDTYRPGVTMPGFGGAVAPFWLPASVVGAIAIARPFNPCSVDTRSRPVSESCGASSGTLRRCLRSASRACGGCRNDHVANYEEP